MGWGELEGLPAPKIVCKIGAQFKNTRPRGSFARRGSRSLLEAQPSRALLPRASPRPARLTVCAPCERLSAAARRRLQALNEGPLIKDP